MSNELKQLRRRKRKQKEQSKKIESSLRLRLIDFKGHKGFVPIILKADYRKKSFYVCFSGGKLAADGQDVSLTSVGRRTLDGLLSLPNFRGNSLLIQELKLGETPISTKIKKIFSESKDGSFICFFGDMAGELDRPIGELFSRYLYR